MDYSLLSGSDKQYWHRFLPVYEEQLDKLKVCKRILEFGIFKGESIRWILNKYPNADIYASDILPIQPEWPIDQNVRYFYVDQGNTETIRSLFKDIDCDLDLIIEDGSHIPEHQKNSLIEGLKHISSGGLYILEDLHTSHPEHLYYKNSGLLFIKGFYKVYLQICNYLPYGMKICARLIRKQQNSVKYIGPLHVLLFLEHLKMIGKDLDKNGLKDFSYNSLFSPDEVQYLFQRISEIKIFKRATLPHMCYSCGSTEFHLHSLKCKCGVDLYSSSDSITAIIRVK